MSDDKRQSIHIIQILKTTIMVYVYSKVRLFYYLEIIYILNIKINTERDQPLLSQL